MTYHELIRRLQRGEQPPVEAVEVCLAAAGKTASDLISDWLRDPPPRPGDRCAACGGKYVVTHTRRAGERRIQYLGCRSCGFRPPRNKVIEMLPP